MEFTDRCEFCGTIQTLDGNSCKNCGANLTHISPQNYKNNMIDKGDVQATKLLLQDSRLSRIYLTGTALLFAVLLGIFWQKSQSVMSQSSGESTFLSSVPGPDGVYNKKAILASAMSDIDILKMMVYDHFLDQGKFPDDMLDLRLNAEEMVSRNIRGLGIELNGVIVVQLTKNIGNDMQLKLIPEIVMGGHKIQWSCLSNLPSYLLTKTSCEAV